MHIDGFIIWFGGSVSAVFFALSGIHCTDNKPLGSRYFYGGLVFVFLTGLLMVVDKVGQVQTKDSPKYKNATDYTYRNSSTPHVTPLKATLDQNGKRHGPALSIVKADKVKYQNNTALFNHNKSYIGTKINANNSNVLVGPINAPVNQTVNISDIQPPKFDIKPIKENIKEIGLYSSKYMLSVGTKIPLHLLHIEIRSRGILKFEVNPDYAGVFTVQAPSIADNIAYQNVFEAKGDYIIDITTRTPSKYEIHLGYKP